MTCNAFRVLENLLTRLAERLVDRILERRGTWDPLCSFVEYILFDHRAPTSAFGKTARHCLTVLRERKDTGDVRAAEEIEDVRQKLMDMEKGT